MSLSLMNSSAPLPLSSIFSSVDFARLLRILPLSSSFTSSPSICGVMPTSNFSLSSSVSVRRNICPMMKFDTVLGDFTPSIAASKNSLMRRYFVSSAASFSGMPNSSM